MPEEITLYCIPFAGGNAYSYRPLEKLMLAGINVHPVELPGRCSRLSEPKADSIETLAKDIVDSIRGMLNEPFAFFGHSMGALLAFLVARILAAERLPNPRHIFVSGKGPPHVISRESRWHELPLPLFTEKLKGLGGCPSAVLEDRELMAYFAPIIRHDMRLVAEYEHKAGMPLDVPLTVMIGTEESTTLEEAKEWGRMTTKECRIETFEGGHFFIFDYLPEISSRIHSTLLTQ